MEGKKKGREKEKKKKKVNDVSGSMEEGSAKK